ncbi:hypothetical protein DL93DRAFT_2077449 [Clavulina sp. PMI_390]|nr:hypothetical protein DL93DRAFT_2077449 [Clavulina sp. PMI_390]
MLSDLGLTRMSMEQAKSIRERRELQEEIADVVKFEKARGMSSSRTRAKAGENAKDKAKKAATSDSEDDEEASVSPEPSPSKGKAKKGMHNPLAFLADQSSDED